jgi:hypothetical protein
MRDDNKNVHAAQVLGAQSNTGIKPICVAKATTWQAFPAMLLM